ncbi:MAG: hypothetical protein QNJ14_10370 [Woeseiaceae bacterium]|nr:hypothetical protein [Woeseiaceae bacterium]
MSVRKRLGIAGLLACLLAGYSVAWATSVRHMNLDALITNSEQVFRGSVISVQPGTVSIGGSEIPTTTYTFEVAEMFKGAATMEKNQRQYVAVTMVGSIKGPEAPVGNLQRFDRFRDVPRLAQGEQYLLFTTAPSQYGLSVTVGLAQGCFDITGGMALNRAGNAGLFNGTAYAGPASGPIEYDELASRIRATIGTR